MTSEPFFLFRDDFAQRSTLFVEPHEIITAENADELEDAFGRLEAARAEGKWSAGYLSYEAGYCLDPALAGRARKPMRTPLLCFGIFDHPASEDHPLAQPVDQRANASFLTDLAAGWNAETYAGRFAVLHDHLRKGNCYQANLTFPIRARWHRDPLDAFWSLTARQPVRYGAVVSLGDPKLVSRSPELFFKINRDGWIETHPMKGTAPRRADPSEDAMEIEKLRSSEKTQAENRMIVDLLRNDISRITETGTLDVPALFEVETYPTLHQMISKVRGKLRPGLTIRDVFAALFPCGSITGAPKVSAMEILDDLEDVAREAYCGAIGYIAPTGEMRFNVAIRTVSLFSDGTAVFNVGGGIVFDSDAQSEYEEALLKARFAAGDEWITR